MVTTKKVAKAKKVKNEQSDAVLLTRAKSKKPVLKKTNTNVQNKTEKNTEILNAKLESVAKLQTKKSIKQKSVVKMNDSFPQLRPNVSLALVSPYRFPISAHTVAVGTARIGGLFFVVVGAILTLFHADIFFNNYALQAQLILSSNTTTGTTVPSECTTGSCATTDSLTTMSTPDVSIDVSNHDDLEGTVQVKLKVREAEKISLNAYFKSQQREVILGRPSKVSSDTWEFLWDTTAFDDGEYKLKALVTNSTGTYEELDDRYVVVENDADLNEEIETDDEEALGTNEVIVETTLESGEDVATTIEEDIATLPSDVSLEVDKNESFDQFRFEVEVSDAKKVKLFAYNPRTSKNILIGYAFKSGDLTWKYRWLVSGFEKGDYEVTAIANIGESEYISNQLTVAIIASDEQKLETEAVDDEIPAPLVPKIQLSILSGLPLFNTVDVRVDVSSAHSIMLYAIPENALTRKYIGAAKLVDKNTWIFTWDTKLIPNGSYVILAEVKNSYGLSTQQSDLVKISNKVVAQYTKQQEAEIDSFVKIAEELNSIKTQEENVEVTKSETEEESGAVFSETIAEEAEFENILNNFKGELDDELKRLATALRSENQNSVDVVKERLEKLKRQIVSANVSQLNKQNLIERIDSHLKTAIKRVEEDIEKTNKILAERTPEKVDVDSDSDGVLDFDEVNIFKTDPFGADSDGDGFTDGAEILSGYNPTDAISETLIAYESPKETGLVREDILIVESVITAKKNDEEKEEKPIAIISGKALPNSFVTLYIYSTPVIVTIKTDADGSWNYRFDKEIEDGEHQVYVGVTDNAGKIVAKSNPFTFIKEAEAFTGASTTVEPKASETIATEGSLFGEYVIYLVLSISVVAIGLLLILLGLHLDGRPRKFTAKNKVEVTV